VIKEIPVQRKTLIPQRATFYQEDIKVRDQAFEAEDRRRAAEKQSKVCCVGLGHSENKVDSDYTNHPINPDSGAVKPINDLPPTL
jgi:hypothetical protein